MSRGGGVLACVCTICRRRTDQNSAEGEGESAVAAAAIVEGVRGGGPCCVRVCVG